MTHGKIILSAAALVVTAVSAFTAKGSKSGRHQLYTHTGYCNGVTCATLAAGLQSSTCSIGIVILYTDAGCTHEWRGATTATL